MATWEGKGGVIVTDLKDSVKGVIQEGLAHGWLLDTIAESILDLFLQDDWIPGFYARQSVSASDVETGLERIQAKLGPDGGPTKAWLLYYFYAGVKSRREGTVK